MVILQVSKEEHRAFCGLSVVDRLMGLRSGRWEGLLNEVEGVSPSAEASTNFWPTTLISEIEKD